MAMAETAQSRYEKKALRRVNIPFNRFTEPELLAYIETVPNKTRYIKNLILEDMKRKGLS